MAVVAVSVVDDTRQLGLPACATSERACEVTCAWGCGRGGDVLGE